MKNIKIIFFDIDGTLIDIEKKQISENTLKALTELKKNGIKICIATGRAPMLVPEFPGVDFDAFLTFNGSYCFDKEQDIFSNPLKKEDVAVIIKNATEIGRPVSLAMKHRLAANGTDQDLSDYYSIAGIEVQIDEDFEVLAQNEEIYQIMVGCLDAEHAALMKNAGNAKLAAWWDRAADIIPADGGKGTAVREILRYYGLTEEEAAAFGDGNNDIEMLRAVGTGIAMGNASEDLKAAADEVCGTAADDGVYFWCRKNGLI